MVVSTVPADALAPLGARATAGAVMTNFDSYIYGTSTWRVNLAVSQDCVDVTELFLEEDICFEKKWQ